jgi:hypothetical protein
MVIMKPPTLPRGTTGFFNDKNEWVCTGSQMGRRSWRGHDANESVKVYLRRERLVDGCYDSEGAYWGGPDNLYRANFDIGDTNEDIFLRADSREDAKAQVRKQLPNARLFN